MMVFRRFETIIVENLIPIYEIELLVAVERNLIFENETQKEGDIIRTHETTQPKIRYN